MAYYGEVIFPIFFSEYFQISDNCCPGNTETSVGRRNEHKARINEYETGGF